MVYIETYCLSTMSRNKKMRGVNFTRNEKVIILGLIRKYRNVIENKRTDAATVASKNEVWQKLASEFNLRSSHCHRTTEQLKTCWENMKRLTRKDKALLKKDSFLTGKGPSKILPVDPLSGGVEELLRPTSEGSQSIYNSSIDNVSHTSEKEKNVEIFEEKVGAEKIGPSTSWTTWSQTELQQPMTENLPSIKVEHDSLEIQDPLPSLLWTAQPTNVVHQSLTKNVRIELESQAIQNPIRINGHNNVTFRRDNISETLRSQQNRNRRQRRKPKSSLDDQLLQSKIELIQILKKQTREEAEQKKLILVEQLEQEKIKTHLLQLELRKKNMEF